MCDSMAQNLCFRASLEPGSAGRSDRQAGPGTQPEQAEPGRASQPAIQPVRARQPGNSQTMSQAASQTRAKRGRSKAEPGSRPGGQKARQSLIAMQPGTARRPSRANQSCCNQLKSAGWPIRPEQLSQSQTVTQAGTSSQPESA